MEQERRKTQEMLLARMKLEQARKAENFRELNRYAKKGQILFTGSSLMEQFPVAEIAASRGVPGIFYNRGIGGTTTDDFLREIDAVLLDLAPKKIFCNIGTNDMTTRDYGDGWMAHLLSNYEKILKTAREKLPDAAFFCMAYYPTCPAAAKSEGEKALVRERTKENLAACNAGVKSLALRYGAAFLDCNAGLTDEAGNCKQEFSIDGVHMYANAYEIVFQNLLPYL
ncbi:MAG: SGNH/GDSL hydrolase family protein [Lachnospiraceae bacterium]